MKLVKSFDEVRVYINKVRSLKKGFLTNFFPEQRKIEIWTTRNDLSVIDSDETVIFLKKDEGFTYILYCATTKEELFSSLSKLPKEGYVFDQIVEARTDASLITGFKDLGFIIRKSLVRMSKINKKTEYLEPNENLNATLEDIQAFHKLLHEHFDKYAEQLPSHEELLGFIEAKHAIVQKQDGQIAGFILYDQTPSTLYLRYWLVNPDFRNQGVGSNLFHEYNRRGASCQRHILWVVEDNDNAIKRYEHYGYHNENMKDLVFTIGIDYK